MPSLGYAEQGHTLPRLCNAIQRCATLWLCIAMPGTALPLPGCALMALVRTGLLCLCSATHCSGLTCFAIAELRIASLSYAFARQRPAELCRCNAQHGLSVRRGPRLCCASRGMVWLRLCSAMRCMALPCLCTGPILFVANAT